MYYIDNFEASKCWSVDISTSKLRAHRSNWIEGSVDARDWKKFPFHLPGIESRDF
jgi:hypothetical protein